MGVLSHSLSVHLITRYSLVDPTTNQGNGNSLGMRLKKRQKRPCGSAILDLEISGLNKYPKIIGPPKIVPR